MYTQRKHHPLPDWESEPESHYQWWRPFALAIERGARRGGPAQASGSAINGTESVHPEPESNTSG